MCQGEIRIHNSKIRILQPSVSFCKWDSNPSCEDLNPLCFSHFQIPRFESLCRRFESNFISFLTCTRYLDESCEKVSYNFDILSWWKTNSNKFQVLSKPANYVLSIPISTVVSESAFSAGSRVLDQFFSFLTLKLVESLICA